MSDDGRPDPDALIERTPRRRGAGRRAASCASTSARRPASARPSRCSRRRAPRRPAARDVVAGVVETHGRAETAAQLQGLEVLPRKHVRRRPRRDARRVRSRRRARAPARADPRRRARPLERSPARATRSAGRTSEELLAAGIDVWTTLNVQHLESLNDVVGGITGVRVSETLPDTFFDRADEVVLVDTPADELLARLKAGKVYGAAQAERAAANFFRKGNLMALRELALRRTADRVEDDVQAYRVDRAIGRVWKTESAVLCCVGPGDGRRAHRAQRRAAGAAARGVVACRLRRDAGAAAPAERAARAHPARGQAGRGARRDHGGAAERATSPRAVVAPRARSTTCRRS